MKRILISMFLALAFAVGALAQDATIVVFTAEEAQTLKAAADKLAAAQKEFDAIKNDLVLKHCNKNDAHLPYAEFWHISSDYRAMVPYWDYSRPLPPCVAAK